MSNLTSTISDKLGGNGSRAIADVARQLAGRGTPTDLIGNSKGPLNESGVTLPPLVKGK